MVNNYYLLRALPHEGAIVRTNGAVHEEYIPDTGWVRSGILIQYFNDESDYYNLYEELTEDDALKRIEGTG